MTLIVSLRVPDGIVLAGDSLATVPGAHALRMQHKQVCPHCGEEHTHENVQDRLRAALECPSCEQPFEVPGIKIPAVTVTQSTASYAQKVFPFLDKFGIGVAGSSIIGTKTVVNHVKSLERSLRKEFGDDGTRRFLDELESLGVTAIAERVYEYMTERYEAAYPDAASRAASGPIAMQVVGFDSPDDPTGKTYVCTWAGQSSIECEDGLPPTLTGDPRIANGIFQVCHQHGMMPAPGIFSLQDAVDYAEFLIATTATAQRFAVMIPTVGGEVDVALITSYAGFQWIKCKALTRQLEQPTPRGFP